MKKPIRVVLIEDDPDWLNIMENLIGKEEDMILVGCAQTQEEGITLSHALNNIDIFLVDINLSGVNLDGIYTALELKREKTSRIIMLTSMSEEDIIQKAFMAGASDYILKKDVHRIPEIIRSNYNKESSPVEAVLKEFRRLKSEEQLKDLTNAEREVFKYIEKGYSRKKIKLETHKSDNTLKTHFKNIFKKLSVSNTKDLLKKVKTGGLK